MTTQTTSLMFIGDVRDGADVYSGPTRGQGGPCNGGVSGAILPALTMDGEQRGGVFAGLPPTGYYLRWRDDCSHHPDYASAVESAQTRGLYVEPRPVVGQLRNAGGIDFGSVYRSAARDLDRDPLRGRALRTYVLYSRGSAWHGVTADTIDDLIRAALDTALAASPLLNAVALDGPDD